MGYWLSCKCCGNRGGSLHSLKYIFSHLLKGVTPISQGDSKPSKLYLKVLNTLPRMQQDSIYSRHFIISELCKGKVPSLSFPFQPLTWWEGRGGVGLRKPEGECVSTIALRVDPRLDRLCVPGKRGPAREPVCEHVTLLFQPQEPPSNKADFP